jgi:hypothetical protein
MATIELTRQEREVLLDAIQALDDACVVCTVKHKGCSNDAACNRHRALLSLQDKLNHIRAIHITTA